MSTGCRFNAAAGIVRRLLIRLGALLDGFPTDKLENRAFEFLRILMASILLDMTLLIDFFPWLFRISCPVVLVTDDEMICDLL